MKLILTAVLVLVSVSLSDTVTQTDWSGGDGVLGPVTDWGNRYNVADQINTTESSLRLASTILSTPVKNAVNANFNGSSSVYAIDIDGDEDIDILGAAFKADDITWWENADGTGTVWTEHTVDNSFNGALSVYATDLDGDGDTDILGTAFLAHKITWWENADGTGTAWTEHTVDDDFAFAYSVFATDVDGDGDTDILGAADSKNNITWWENTDSTGTMWAKHTVDDDFNGAHSVYATDVDGDGDTDVLGAACKADDITWWENTDGTGTSWTKHTVDDNFDSAYSVFATDIDDDGDVDILGTAYYADDIVWWENTDGTGTAWVEHTLDDDFNGARSVFAADLDGDGDTDVLGAAWFANDITWWENTDGTGSSWTKHTVNANFGGACSVFAADVDGDGNTDVLGAASVANDITWWNVASYSMAGTLESSILDAGTVDSWNIFASSEVEPVGTSVGYQFRSSDDSVNMGTWSDTVFITGTSLSGILADSTDFLQYRVILQTTDPAQTPVLNDLAFTYSTYLSINDSSICWGLTPATNPSLSNCSVMVSAPKAGMVNLTLHDVTGRVITEYSQELSAGTHSVSFNNIAQGVYFCTMHAEDFTATERMVVIK